MTASVLIPTIGRPTLNAAVRSALESRHVCEVLVVADGASALRAAVETLSSVEDERLRVAWVTTPGVPDWGHSIRHVFGKHLKGDYAIWLDDDNLLYASRFDDDVDEHGADADVIFFRVEFEMAGRGNRFVPSGRPPASSNVDGMGIVVKTSILKTVPWPRCSPKPGKDGGDRHGDWLFFDALRSAGHSFRITSTIIGIHR